MSVPYLYLDNAASSHPKPEEVYLAADRALRQGANPGRSGHTLALDSSRIVLDAREAVAELLGSGDSSRVVFTLNASHALNQAIKGTLKPGDHVVTSSMEHNSVARPLFAMAKEGVELTVVKADREGRIHPADVVAAMRDDTALVALTHASNVCGTLLDVKTVGAAVRSRGALFLLDASQTAGTYPINVDGLDVDMLAAPGHKGLLGPQGTGILYVRPGLDLKPVIHGGTGFASESREMPCEMPERLEGGTVNTPGLAGLGAGARYLLKRTVEEVREGEMLLVRRALELLGNIEGLRLYGPTDPADRVAVVSFNLFDRDGVAHDGATVGFLLDDEYSIGVRVGLHCSPEAHKTIGTFPSGTVRVGFGPFNTETDVERLARAVGRIAKTLNA